MKKYVLAQPGGFSNTIKENLLVIKQAGYDGVFFSAEYSGVNDELIEYTRGIGLDIETIHLPYSKKAINTLWDDTKDPEESFEILRKGIDLAARNKVKTVILHTCNGYHPPEIGETGLKNYRYLAQYCKDTLRHKTMALIFEKPSLRTRTSFEIGMHQLGGEAIYLSPAEIGLGKREPVKDVTRVIERFADVIAWATELVRRPLSSTRSFSSSSRSISSMCSTSSRK